MTSLLAIATTPEHDRHLVDALDGCDADTITVLIETELPARRRAWAEGPAAEQVRDRLAGLIARAEAATGATVVGMVTGPAAVPRDGFDAVVHPAAPVLATAA